MGSCVMSAQIVDEADFCTLDPNCVPDVFCEGVSAIAKLGKECLRFTIYATRERGVAHVERIVVAQLIWQRDALRVALCQAEAAIDGGLFLSATAPGVVPN